MVNYARIISDVAVDVSNDPTNQFHPDIAAQFEPVPDEVQHGWIRTDGQWAAPAPAPQPEPWPAPVTVTPTEIRIAEIEAELTSIDAASARPLRAILAATTSGGTADPADVAKLAELEAQAKALRTELASLDE